MKKYLPLLAVAGFTLVSAAPSSDPIPWEDAESLRSYPPCSATVTDRCIQTYERGVSASRNLARSEPLGRNAGPGVGGPDEAVPQRVAQSDYPPCSRTVTDRCIQTGGSAASTRMARSAPAEKHHAATQLAMRAGERR